MENETLINQNQSINEEYNELNDTKLWKKRLHNVIFMGISFLAIFVSYNTTQNFMTSLYEQNGQISLFIVYFTFALTGIINPLIIRRIGEKWSLILGGCCIVPYIFVNIFKNEIVLLFVSIFVGFGQSISWSAEGSLLVRCSHPTQRGRNSGIFFFVYQSNQIIGNGFAFLLSKIEIDHSYLFLIFTVLCIIGILPFLLIRMNIMPPIEKVTLKDDMKKVWSLIKSKQMLLLIPMYLYSGLTQCYIFGEFTAMFGVDSLSIAMVIFGFTNMSISYLFGKLSDKIGRIPIFLISSVFIMICLTLVVVHYVSGRDDFTILFIAFVCLGISDAGFNTQIDTLMGRYFNAQSDAAYACFYSIQSLATAFGFLIFMLLASLIVVNYWYRVAQAFVILFILVVAFICLFILNKSDPIELQL